MLQPEPTQCLSRSQPRAESSQIRRRGETDCSHLSHTTCILGSIGAYAFCDLPQRISCITCCLRLRPLLCRYIILALGFLGGPNNASGTTWHKRLSWREDSGMKDHGRVGRVIRPRQACTTYSAGSACCLWLFCALLLSAFFFPDSTLRTFDSLHLPLSRSVHLACSSPQCTAIPAHSGSSSRRSWPAHLS